MKKQKGKLRVYEEIPKTQHTTHWDLDYMTNAEIESLYEQAHIRNTKQKRLRLMIMISVLILILLFGIGFLLSN